ncbi:2OG-Fe(II) oxygenase [Candidatus Saccharibacteria bacterium]|nr:2OG-Fe(II) oxygenase [Candidatus Saccharibacteria bacterium]
MTKEYEPRIIGMEELCPFISDNGPDVNYISSCVQSLAEPTMLNHSFFTSRDERTNSMIRRTPPYTFADDRLVEGVVYNRLARLVGKFLDVSASRLTSPITTVGHVYHPGDESSEAHVDYYPSVTWFLQCSNDGGELVIAKNPVARTIIEIEEDAWVVKPKNNTIALFDGQVLPHYVRGVPKSSNLSRVSINYSFAHECSPPEFGPDRYLLGKRLEWMNK